MSKQDKSVKSKSYRRLDRILAEAGYGSRSETKKIIASGRVRNSQGQVLDNPAARIPLRQIEKIQVEGRPIEWQIQLYYMLNKPDGVVTANQDRLHPVVSEYLPLLDLERGSAPVGRLDLDTTGLLLFTTDGQLNHRLTSPNYGVEKIYLFSYHGSDFSVEDCELVARGLELPDHGKLKPGKLEILAPGRAKLVIAEGIFHQVKRMVEQLGRQVSQLERISFGPLDLDQDLELGQGRPLDRQEIDSLYSCVDLDNPLDFS